MRTMTALLITLAVFAAAQAGRLACRNERPVPRGREPGSPPMRIVSLAPSITDTLCTLDLGAQIVGLTRFCEPAADAGARAVRVGGYHDINYEALAIQAPDLVLLLAEHIHAAAVIEGLGIHTLAVDHRTLDGVLASIDTIGAACGRRDRAARVTGDMAARMARVRARTRGLPRPRVLVCVDRAADTGTLRDVYVAGSDDYYDAILAAAGGVNACEGGPARFPRITVEGILRIDPDVVLDLSAATRAPGDGAPEKDWLRLHTLRAARAGRVHGIRARWAVVPGPQVIQAIEQVASLLHPYHGEVPS